MSHYEPFFIHYGKYYTTAAKWRETTKTKCRVGKLDFFTGISTLNKFNFKCLVSFYWRPSFAVEFYYSIETNFVSFHCVKSVQIRSNFWSVFSPNAGKYGPEITPYLYTFQAQFGKHSIMYQLIDYFSLVPTQQIFWNLIS